MGESVPLLAIVAFACVTLAVLVLLIAVVTLRQRLGRFMKGKDGASLEATLAWLTQKVATIDETLEAHKDAFEFIDKRVRHSIRGYSLIRYDAYIGAGGAQSFSSALLDERGDGSLLSVVVSRSHTGVYAKKIIAGVAESSLTDEETEALHQAMKGLK